MTTLQTRMRTRLGSADVRLRPVQLEACSCRGKVVLCMAIYGASECAELLLLSDLYQSARALGLPIGPTEAYRLATVRRRTLVEALDAALDIIDAHGAYPSHVASLRTDLIKRHRILG
jgi:hypothetical protein